MKSYAACNAYRKWINSSRVHAFVGCPKVIWRKIKLLNVSLVGAKDVPVGIERGGINRN